MKYQSLDKTPDFDQAIQSISFFKHSNDNDSLCFWNPSDHNNFRLGFYCAVEFIDLLREYPSTIGANLLFKVIQDMNENITTETAKGFFTMMEHVIVRTIIGHRATIDLAKSIENEIFFSREFILETVKN
uniref:Uncharacterized protein n=1 Tax=Pectobacterium carotovorum TaxID=554 RepID=A0A0K0MPU4_PECCA|nr:hypothetical protein [Pectobacterium carotovorum]AKG47454.1 hypothetical protein pA_00014 [Pectobacterium carotovorum]